MSISLYRELLAQLQRPQKVMLNYSGESTLHPDLIPAIGLARQTGAFVELVSALASVPLPALQPLAESGLGRLTVSLHALDAEKFQQIYRHGSVDALRDRLDRFTALSRASGLGPVVDIAFVAMQHNLDQLSPVAEYANSLRIEDVMIFPVMRRDPIPLLFPTELQAPAMPTEGFRNDLVDCVERIRQEVPEVRLTICNPAFTAEIGDGVGRVPREYPWPLPAGAQIHSCEQNPFETMHVLSNGDVVTCEVRDRHPLGNLTEKPLSDIWHGESYQRFREQYQRGEVPECRQCIWKKAYRPAPLEPQILAARGANAQLHLGWYDVGDEGLRWSRQEATAVLKRRPNSQVLHLCGVLPPAPAGDANELAILCGDSEVGRVMNPWDENMDFGLDFPVPECAGDTWRLTFRTTHTFRARERNAGKDQRELGFALVLAASQPLEQPPAGPERQAAIAACPAMPEACGMDRHPASPRHRDPKAGGRCGRINSHSGAG